MADLYSNENFSVPVVKELRQLGHDVLTSHEAGNSRQEVPDARVLEFATNHGRAVVTFNRSDFVRLHKKNPNHSGVIVCSQDQNSLALAKRIHFAIELNKPLAGKLIRVNLNA
jgi:hypothetical protein